MTKLEYYANKVDNVSKKQKEYCLACIAEFKPDLEEFIIQMLEEAEIENSF